jgi:hypothetical protein
MAITRATWTDDDGTGTTGTLLNDARLQADVYDPVDAVITYGCRAYHDTTQSISNAAFNAVSFNSEDYDTGGFHSTAVNTSRFTVPAGAGGTYLIIGHVVFAANGTGQRGLTIGKNGGGATINGVSAFKSSPSGTYVTMVNIMAVLVLAAGDYIELLAYQDSGGALNIGVATTYYSNSLCIKRLA